MTNQQKGIFSEARALLSSGNIRLISLTSMLTGVYVSLLNTILQPFVVHYLFYDVAILGILVSIGGRPSGLASSMVQPFAGYLADVFGRSRLILIGSAVGIISMISFAVAAATRSLTALSFAYLLFGLSLLGTPATQAVVAESVAMETGKVNVAFSVVFFFTALPGAIIPFAAGFLTTSLGYVPLFTGSALLEFSNLVLLTALLVETKDRPVPLKGEHPDKKFAIRSVLKLPPGFIKIFTP